MAKPPDRTKPSWANKGLRDEDAALFDSAMRDVKKFSGKDENPAVTPNRTSASPTSSASRDQRFQEASGRPAPKLPDLSPGASADVDTRTMDRLRRGRLRPEARLDLHGLTQDIAHRALERFIAQSRSSDLRCVIIITGKGRVSEGGGTLRNQLPKWLNAPGIRPHILAFTSAQSRDGGAGAVYVLLRRRR